MKLKTETCEPTTQEHDKTNKMSCAPGEDSISIAVCPVCSETSLLAWRSFWSLTILIGPSQDWSYCTHVQADVFAGYMSFCRFCHALAQPYHFCFFSSLWLRLFVRLLHFYQVIPFWYEKQNPYNLRELLKAHSIQLDPFTAGFFRYITFNLTRLCMLFSSQSQVKPFHMLNWMSSFMHCSLVGLLIDQFFFIQYL